MAKLKTYFMQQKMMTKVLYSLLPIFFFSLYLYGLRLIILLLIVSLVGILSEYAIMRLINGHKAKVTESVLVSCLLFTLTLPPTIPYWIAAVGIAFGIVFGKAVFGGFAKNIFNPALVGRCFIYVSFPAQMTMTWARPFSGFPGGLTRLQPAADALTQATPMIAFNNEGTTTAYSKLFLGNVAGSLGESSALLILLAAIYLIVTKTASWKIMLSSSLSFAGLNAILFYSGVSDVNPIFALLSGGFLFASVFMATDPVSAPRLESAKIVFGILIGVIAVVIRTFSLFTEGVMFAILISNAFVPLIERNMRALKDKRASRKKVAA